MTSRGYAAYQAAAVTSMQSKEKLLLMAYDGAIRFVERAQEGIRQESPKMKGEAISKILAIVMELDGALDRETGGEVVDNLGALYQWIMGRVTEANLRSDIHALEEVRGVLATIREGFEGAIKQQHPEPSPVIGVGGKAAMGGMSFAV